MLSTAARARMTVVLVGARNPHNIGAAARAMHDFGFSDLRIVNDFAAPFEAAKIEASPAAVAAQSVMERARRFDTLAEAIADCTTVIGTTAIGVRELVQPVLTLQEAAPKILTALSEPEGHVALLFGSEKTGLTNEQLSHCHLLATIPLFSPSGATGEKMPRHLSMNLGQSVAVCLYELSREGIEEAVEVPVMQDAPATGADRERLMALTLEVLQATGYARRFPANATEAVLRQLSLQLGTSHREAMMWMGILKQILWHDRDVITAGEVSIIAAATLEGARTSSAKEGRAPAQEASAPPSQDADS
jgi:TrmH family RNA methyltransferase